MSQAPAIIETHAHLDDSAFDPDRDEVIERARQAGVRRFLNIAYRPEIWIASVALRQRHPDIDVVAGIHPQDADRFIPGDADALADRLLELQPRGVGEAFEVATGLPLVIHQREAGERLMAELDRWPALERVVLHSFDGDRRLADWAVERGWFAGVGGLACRPRSSALREALTHFPPEKLLLETDSPYLAPPAAKSRRNEPANLPIVAETLAPLWGMSQEELCDVTTENAERVFGW